MNLNSAPAPAARLVSFRYMTYEELAAALGSSRRVAHELVRQRGWSRHLDRHGRPRASVPEVFLDSWQEMAGDDPVRAAGGRNQD